MSIDPCGQAFSKCSGWASDCHGNHTAYKRHSHNEAQVCSSWDCFVHEGLYKRINKALVCCHFIDMSCAEKLDNYSSRPSFWGNMWYSCTLEKLLLLVHCWNMMPSVAEWEELFGSSLCTFSDETLCSSVYRIMWWIVSPVLTQLVVCIDFTTSWKCEGLSNIAYF